MKLPLLGSAILAAACWSAGVAPQVQEEPTYVRDIAPVFAKKCVPCHTDGGVGPFPLETYKQVRARATLVRYVLMQRKMPPLSALSDMGKLRRIEPMTDAELVALQGWVRDKMPLGGVEPEPKPIKSEWGLGTPDLVVQGGSGVTVKAEGAPYSMEIRVFLPIDTPHRIRAIDFRSESGRSWRRAIVARAYPRDEKREVYSPLGLPAGRLIGSWGLGGMPWRLPTGAGVEIQPGEDLAVIPLFQPSGKPETGAFEIALYFDDSSTTAAEWQTMGGADFVIPPQDGFTDLHTTTTLADDIDLVSVLPEARLYCRLIRLVAILPDGNSKVLFMVRNWDSEWAGSYNFEKPVRLPKGTKLDLTMTYDNSGHALGEERRNPPPIRFGPTAADELFWLHYQYVRVATGE